MTVWVLAAVLQAAPAVPSATTWSGVIRDAATGAPLAARVEVLGGGRKVQAEADGRFSIEIPSAGGSLVFSLPGYHVLQTRLDPPARPIEASLLPTVSLADRVEVTATRAREGTDAATFTNLSSERVRESYWAQDPAILFSEVAPGFFATNDSGNGIGYSYFTIRGFGQARTRVSLDGAPLNDAESGELFFIDLADFLSTAGDVQIRRGVFGLSGLGGAVDITTRTPALDPSVTLTGGLGSFGTGRLTAQFDSGLVGGQWALSARYSRLTTDGYRDQSWVDSWNYYFSLGRFGRTSRLRLQLFGGPEDTHLAYEGIPKAVLEGGLSGDPEVDRRTNPLSWTGEVDHFFQPHYKLVHEKDFGSSTRLAQTLYLFQGDGYYQQFRKNRRLEDYNLPEISLPDGSSIARTDLVRRRNVDEWDAGYVPTLTHRTGAWTLSATGEARVHKAHHLGTVEWAQFYPPAVAPAHPYYDYGVDKLSATAGVGADWRAHPRLTMSGGLQYAHHQYRMRDDSIKDVSFVETFGFLLPRVGLLWSVARETELYANLARGGREPFFRSIYDPQDPYSSRASLEPEDVWNSELGISVRRQTWRARINAYFMAFRNEIVYGGALDDNGVPVYGNGARSRHDGVEVDASFNPGPRLGLDAVASFSRNVFTEYAENTWDGSLISYDGNRIAGYPDLMLGLTARTEVGPLRLSGTVRHVGGFYLDNSQSEELRNDAFTLLSVDARIGLPRRLAHPTFLDRFELQLRVSNLLDQRYTSFGYVDAGTGLFIPAAGRNVYAGLTVGF
jgi:iron complex outermembrane receptor protein